MSALWACLIFAAGIAIGWACGLRRSSHREAAAELRGLYSRVIDHRTTAERAAGMVP